MTCYNSVRYGAISDATAPMLSAMVDYMLQSKVQCGDWNTCIYAPGDVGETFQSVYVGFTDLCHNLKKKNLVAFEAAEDHFKKEVQHRMTYHGH